MKNRRAWIIAAVCLPIWTAPVSAGPDHDGERAALPPGAIEHILVIDLENESFGTTFGPTSPAAYLNTTLLAQGQLINNYFATSHVSLGNYVSQVSGQAPTASTNNDCLDLGTLTHPPVLGGFTDVSPADDAADQASFPGQVVEMVAFTRRPPRAAKARARSATSWTGWRRQATITAARWRAYAEDMGNDVTRDYGTPDPQGGATCAHPPVGGADHSNSATANDQYATRHNPWVYFHSVIDDQARCDAHVVPLGSVAVSATGGADVFSGHLYADLQSPKTTPAFLFVSPNLCNDGHDATCTGTNVEGGKQGGLVGADLWLKHWMPMIFASPAYRSGKMLVVLTFDEGGLTDARACPAAEPGRLRVAHGPQRQQSRFQPRARAVRASDAAGDDVRLSGRRPDRRRAVQQALHQARHREHDRRLQPLRGAPQLRGPSGDHARWRRRPWASGVCGQARAEDLRRRRVQRLP